MSRPRKWDDTSERRTAQNDLRRQARATARSTFTCVDGEGQGKWRDHKYVLLGIGQDHISDPGGLSADQVFAYLWERYLDSPKDVFAGFYLGYDFTQWFKTLPENRARILFDARTRQRTKSGRNYTPFPVQWDEWEFDILGMKRFKLRKVGAKSWMYVNDTGPFFQASLLSVIDPSKWNDPVVSNEEYATIEEGKEKRDTAVLGKEMIRYNALENDILGRVLCRLESGIQATGVRLKKNQWFGPGQAAQGWLSTQRDIPKPVDLPARYCDLARRTYFGGWFEIMAHGHVPGITWEYDINSAYPAIIAELPCLLHGEWLEGTRTPPKDDHGNSLTIVHAQVKGSHPNIGSMPHRTSDGRVSRPLETAGWYWEDELEASRKTGLIDHVRYIEWARYIPCDCRPPLRNISGLYSYRHSVGKNTPEGKAAKLIYNSIYGKFAQSLGSPVYGNAIYASRITSGCRKRILDAISTHPHGARSVVMVATDGVYFTSEHPTLSISERLGEWDVTQRHNLTLFKPGVYWDDSTRNRLARGESASFKARGISAKYFAGELCAIDKHYEGWRDIYPVERDPTGDRAGWHPLITYKSGFSMVTCIQAIQRNKWYLAGAVSEAELKQDADPISKRRAGHKSRGIYWSQPHSTSGPKIESTPYDKRFGQPEINPEEYGITPDGYNIDIWRQIMKGE